MLLNQNSSTLLYGLDSSVHSPTERTFSCPVPQQQHLELQPPILSNPFTPSVNPSTLILPSIPPLLTPPHLPIIHSSSPICVVSSEPILSPPSFLLLLLFLLFFDCTVHTVRYICFPNSEIPHRGGPLLSSDHYTADTSFLCTICSSCRSLASPRRQHLFSLPFPIQPALSCKVVKRGLCYRP